MFRYCSARTNDGATSRRDAVSVCSSSRAVSTRAPLAAVQVTGSLTSCEVHDLSHEVLDTVAALRRRFPGYQLPPA